MNDFPWHIPTSWQWAQLDEIGKTTSGGTPKRDRPDYYGGNIPWLKSGELNDGFIDATEEFLTENGLASSSAKMFPIGTICIALYGATVGKLGILKIAAATNQAVCGISPAQDIDPKYVFRFLEHQRPKLIAASQGGAQPNISQTIVRAVQVPVAPAAEQKRIVEAIEALTSDLLAAVAALKRVQSNLKRYRGSVLKAACQGHLVPTEAELARQQGRSYETGEQLLARILKERRAKWEADQLAKMLAAGKPPKNDDWKKKYKEPNPPDTTNVPGLPEGWVWASFGQAFEVFVGATPSRAKPSYWNGDIPWVSSGEVGFCRIKETREHITLAGLQNSSTNLHPSGTVLLGMIGEGKTRGQAAILDIDACNNQNCAAIRVSEAGLPPEYVYRYLEGQYEHTRAIGSGNNQPALNKTRVENMLIPLPPLAELQRIVSEVERRFSVLDTIARDCKRGASRASRLYQAILKRAFEGKLVPQDPNDEPASRLLDRIRADRASAEPVVKRSSRKRAKAESGV